MLREYTTMAFVVLLWLVIGTFNLQVHGAPMTANETGVSTTKPPETLKDFEKQVDQLMGSIIKMVLPYFLDNADVGISSSCSGTIVKIVSDLRRLKFMPLKLLDAMGKPMSGSMEGSFAVMGDYEECLNVRVSKKKGPLIDPKDELYHGQYCTIRAHLPPALTDALEDYGSGNINASHLGKLNEIVHNIPLKNFARTYFEYNIGLCIPSTCSMKDLETLVKSAQLPVPIEVKRCESKDQPPITPDQIVILILLGMLIVLVVTGSALDGILYLKDDTYKGHHEGKLVNFFLSFSLYNNTKKFMKTEKDASSEVTCINGMYVNGTFLVIVYHTYFVPFLHYVYRHASHLDGYFKDFAFTLISTMAISIETYFLFSGFFLVYARWSYAAGRDVKINIPRLIFRRYMRLTPSMLLILAFIVILPLFGSGPIWADVFGVAAANTRKFWWKYVIMINNFLAPKDQNFLYLWFIPCLMQATIAGVFLCWILSKKPKLGIAAIVLTGITCNVVLGVITYQNEYPPSYAIYFQPAREKFEIPIYTSPLSHVSSFCVGMILGYYMSRNKVITFKPVTVVVGWILCIACTVGIQLVLYLYHDGSEPSPVFSAVYAAFHRGIFSLGMAWVILACTHGYGGILGKLLCWKGFGPLSKLGYASYLIHYLVLGYHISVAQTPMTYSHFEIWIRVFSYNSLTFAFAYLMYITFELPLKYLEKYLFARKSDPKVNPTPNGADKIQGKINGTDFNGTERIVIKGKICDISGSCVPVENVWAQNGVFKEYRPENSKL